MSISRKVIFLLLISSIALFGVTACSSQSESSDSHTNMNMASMDIMPAEVQSAPVTVQEAYQFNVANPDIMKNIPCYCGCGNVGHTSNYACYVSSTDDKGNIKFDNHALGCSICVDITQDVMRMLEDGKSPQDARAYIDSTYSKYGPSNIP
ncbi:MAG: PCYCGC motif-containing (lipo)protein [Chloroflexota bacterium]